MTAIVLSLAILAWALALWFAPQVAVPLLVLGFFALILYAIVKAAQHRETPASQRERNLGRRR